MAVLGNFFLSGGTAEHPNMSTQAQARSRSSGVCRGSLPGPTGPHLHARVLQGHQSLRQPIHGVAEVRIHFTQRGVMSSRLRARFWRLRRCRHLGHRRHARHRMAAAAGCAPDRPERRPSERDQAGWLVCLNARTAPLQARHEWG